MMSASLPPGLHVAGEPVPGRAVAGRELPGVGVGLWPLVALTALELAFVLSLISLGGGCTAADAVRVAAATSGIAGVLFYAPRTLTVIGRRQFAAPSGPDRPQ